MDIFISLSFQNAKYIKASPIFNRILSCYPNLFSSYPNLCILVARISFITSSTVIIHEHMCVDIPASLSKATFLLFVLSITDKEFILIFKIVYVYIDYITYKHHYKKAKEVLQNIAYKNRTLGLTEYRIMALNM
jgi:hypothetical protein